jgi:2-C-methyl-D-erythritol 4-phosphate cytidylyltransferase
MNSAVPKQFIELAGKPVLMRTIEKFRIAIPDIHIILVLARTCQQQWERLCEKHNFKDPYQLAEGGETRFHSVKNGLALVPENCIVGIHDAARPLVSDETIQTAFKIASSKGNAVPAVAISESIREVKDTANRAVDRNHYVIIQTPQCFRSDVIKSAFLQEYGPSFTDDASVLEAFGEKINLTEGNRENIKITTPQDLIIAEALLK